MPRRTALLLYLALSVPFGIAVHLGSEFAGLGRDADDLAFSPLHGYLAVLAVIALSTFATAGGFFAPAAERRRRIGLMASALPFSGRGPGFFAFSAAIQFGFFLVTQLGEGCPLCQGDALVGVIAAIVASLIGSFALIALRRQIVHVVSVLARTVERGRSLLQRRLPRHQSPLVVTAFATFASTRGNRPPPQPLLA
jgi:hypothetical protein